MSEPDNATRPQVALIVGGGPGISASCARLFASEGMSVAIAARNPDKPVLKSLSQDQGVKCYQCDASQEDAVEKLFQRVIHDLGNPSLVVHNIDGRSGDIFRKGIEEVEPALVKDTLHNSTFSAFLVGQQAAKCMLSNPMVDQGHRGTIIFTNASTAFKGYPRSGAFAMASHGKSGLAQSRGNSVAGVQRHLVFAGWTAHQHSDASSLLELRHI